jgi:ATP-dependent Clp protease ATP-binding subunit ClpA
MRTSHGNTIRFRRCALIFSTTLKPGEATPSPQALREFAASRIPREIVDRLDAIVPFESIDVSSAAAVVKQKIKEFYETVRHHRITLRIHEDAVAILVSACYNANGGLSALDREIGRRVISPFSKLVQHGAVKPNSIVELVVNGNDVQFVCR